MTNKTKAALQTAVIILILLAITLADNLFKF